MRNKNKKKNLTADEVENNKEPNVRKKPSDDNELVNFYDIIPKKFLTNASNPNFDIHHFELPMRMCITAPSGSGKTNFLLNLIRVFSKGQGTFETIYIITSNKDEPLYNWLSQNFDQIKVLEGIKNTPNMDDFDKKFNTLVVWDDLVLNKNQDEIEKYFMRARKQNCSVIYLSQSYYDVPKFIRKNSNYLAILNLGGSARDKTSILKQWGSELTADELNQIYNDATKTHMNPLIITGGKVDINKKYRSGFNKYYSITDLFGKT